jgi:transcriptional regulator with XRE-family HTH domain
MARALSLGESLRHIMDTLGLTPQELARTVGASDKTVARWLADETYPQHDSREKLAELEHFTEIVSDAFVDSESVAAWLRHENRYLGGLSPYNALLSGRIDRAEGAIEIIRWGIFT